MARWHSFISGAVDFPRRYLAEDRRTNADKAKYVTEVLRLVREVRTLIAPDFMLGAGDGQPDPPNRIGDGPDYGRLHVLKNVCTSSLSDLTRRGSVR
jgi:hypothetical protein